MNETVTLNFLRYECVVCHARIVVQWTDCRSGGAYDAPVHCGAECKFDDGGSDEVDVETLPDWMKPG